MEETSRYMFRILAAKMFFEDPEAFGFNIPVSERYPYIPPERIVTVNSTITDLVDFAERNGVSFAQLKRANLWLRGNSLPDKSGKTYKIIIPSDI